MHKEKCTQIDFPFLSYNRLMCVTRKTIIFFLISFIFLFIMFSIFPGKGIYNIGTIGRLEQSLKMSLGLSLYIILLRYVNLNYSNGLMNICKNKHDFIFFSKIRTICSIKFAILFTMGFFLLFITLDVFVLSESFQVLTNVWIVGFLSMYAMINCLNDPGCKLDGGGG